MADLVLSFLLIVAQRVDLDLVTGAETTDYGDLARAEHLSGMCNAGR